MSSVKTFLFSTLLVAYSLIILGGTLWFIITIQKINEFTKECREKGDRYIFSLHDNSCREKKIPNDIDESRKRDDAKRSSQDD